MALKVVLSNCLEVLAAVSSARVLGVDAICYGCDPFDGFHAGFGEADSAYCANGLGCWVAVARIASNKAERLTSGVCDTNSLGQLHPRQSLAYPWGRLRGHRS